MIVALLALALSLGGVAYALQANSVKSRTIKDGQVKLKDINKQAKAAWLYTDENGNRINGSAGVTVERVSEGLYFVRFPFSVRARALLAQAQSDDDNNITVERCGGLNGDNGSCSPDENDNPRTVLVQSVDTENGDDSTVANADTAFYLAAIP